MQKHKGFHPRIDLTMETKAQFFFFSQTYPQWVNTETSLQRLKQLRKKVYHLSFMCLGLCFSQQRVFTDCNVPNKALDYS